MKVLTWQLTIIILAVVLCITALEVYALSKGIDGTMMSVSIGLMIGLPTLIIAKKAAIQDKNVKR